MDEKDKISLENSQRNFVLSAFSSKSPEKSGNSSKLVSITFAQYCTRMHLQVVRGQNHVEGTVS